MLRLEDEAAEPSLPEIARVLEIQPWHVPFGATVGTHFVERDRDLQHERADSVSAGHVPRDDAHTASTDLERAALGSDGLHEVLERVRPDRLEHAPVVKPRRMGRDDI